ncbi:MAG TPA: hypothetical protein VFX12_04685 [Vicinamibacterales bacterium]|nr:hypothetical protein [Vicinamibacterales bacterium]
MSRATLVLFACAFVASVGVGAQSTVPAATPHPGLASFQTSDRCIACHNGLTTPSGDDVSIGFDWRASVMANSSRDPYWQASVRRESLDHAPATGEIEDTCSRCHMPMARYDAKVHGKPGKVFANLPFHAHRDGGSLAEDGVSCAVCHQLSAQKLGEPDTFTGNFIIDPPDARGEHREYGPYAIDQGHTLVMKTSTEGFRPTQSLHIRQSELCASCHTLITEALDASGKQIGRLPEQVPYQEWLHSDYKGSQSCQACHMPVVPEAVSITRVFGQPRQLSRHVFVAANFLLQRMLTRYHDELDVAALPQELEAASNRTIQYLATQAARVTIGDVTVAGGTLRTAITVENLGGHKLPTAYPSRRAWLHFTVRDGGGRVVFESGALRPDGSIAGNDNDADKTKFEPHYREITSADQVEIFESILGDANGQVTTGLLNGVRYLKDNRLLPQGFDKQTAEPDIAVHGDAADDPGFTGGSARVQYAVPVSGAGPFTVAVELLYQPIGFRWAQNLKAYDTAFEPRRFTGYYDAMAPGATATLAHATR